MNKKITIFLPVRNGGKYLPLCVESILAQSEENFDLIILENQSTDGTAEWLEALEEKEPRVQVIPSKLQLSIEDNWKRILSIPKNQYMTIIGHDDILDSNYLETIINLINRYPNASLYQTHFRFIDEYGKEIRKCLPMQLKQNAADYLSDVLNYRIDSYGTGYAMRSALYDELGGIPSFNNLMFADHALWVMLIHKSWKATSNLECFSYRIHANSTSSLTNGLTCINGLKQFNDFLVGYEKKYHIFSDTFYFDLQKYIFSRHRNIYFRYYYEANRRNSAINRDVKKAILLSLEYYQPILAERFNASILIRLLELSNLRIFRKYFSGLWGLYRNVRMTIKNVTHIAR